MIKSILIFHKERGQVAVVAMKFYFFDNIRYHIGRYYHVLPVIPTTSLSLTFFRSHNNSAPMKFLKNFMMYAC